MAAQLEGITLDTPYRRPIISLIGAEEAVTLDGVGSGYTLKPGSTGLGMAPVELATSALAAGGATLRNRRSGEREVFLPFDVHFGYGDEAYGLLEDARRHVEKVVSDEVEIRVLGKDGPRSAFGYYQDGLDGAFSKGDVNQHRMNLALNFRCPDPWWYGAERVREWHLSTVIKPYWTSYPRLPHYPAWVSSSTVLGEFEFTVSGDADASPVWTVYPPGADLLIECGNGCGKRLFLEGEITEPITFDTANEDITSPTMDRGELWERVSLDSDFFTLPPGENKVRVAMVGAQGASKVVLSYREKFKAGH